MDNPTPSHGSQVQAGVASLDGRPYFLASADYPYYRDDPANWADRLEKLKALGCRMVTFYIPWRHHDLLIDGRRVLDFTGQTQPNRNVTGFLDLVQAAGLKAIVKPGPFIHAEVNYGGLPDFVCPRFNPAIEPMLRGSGQPFLWGGNALIPKNGVTGDKPILDGPGLEPWPLPAPLDPHFLNEVQGWFQAVRDEVLAPRLHPHGPLVLLQIGNEGIYSNHQRPPWAYDYSRSGLAFFRQFLQARYGSLAAYNHRHGTFWIDWDAITPPTAPACPTSLPDSLHYADWAEFQAVYMARIYDALVGFAGLDLPYLLNVNPPSREHFGADAWLARINPDLWPGVHYGFTNWIGVACEDEDVVDRYTLMVKRARGFNLEENWGFSKVYESAFDYEAVSFFQTLLAIALGGTGYNIYTGVGTDQADPQIDRLTRGVYPDSAPVDAAGQLTPKAGIVTRLNQFFNRWGGDFLQTQPHQPLAWGLYLPYAHTAVWLQESDQEAAARLGLAECGRAALRFFRQARRAQLDPALVNLAGISPAGLQAYPCLALAVGRWMDASTQAKLLAYARAGGRLMLFGDGPELDEAFQPCSLLDPAGNRILRLPLSALDDPAWLDLLRLAGLKPALAAQTPAAAEALANLYVHPTADVQYLVVLAGRQQPGPLEWTYQAGGAQHRLRLVLPRSGAGVVRIEAGRLSAALLKGCNDYLSETVRPCVSLDGVTTEAQAEGDWMF